MNRLRMWIPAFFLMISACSSDYKGVECQGEIKSLTGQPLGNTGALIIDRFNSFTVTMPQMNVESGMLHSADRAVYIPSAVTREGFLAQRLSDKKFTLIDAQQNKWITFICP